MSEIKVTKEQIDLLMNSADVKVETVFGKCTTVTMRLPNGFILTESSACVDPANYDPKMGKELCYQHIENRLWELEGYALQKKMAEGGDGGGARLADFGWALRQMKQGQKVRRRGWNGKGMFLFIADDLELHTPADLSCVKHLQGELTLPSVVIKTADERFCVGWLASQTDMLAEDWEVFHG